MHEVNAFLKEWQPLWQFALMVLLTGLLGFGRLLNQVWDRRLHEREAAQEGVDPDEAEWEGAS